VNKWIVVFTFAILAKCFADPNSEGYKGIPWGTTYENSGLGTKLNDYNKTEKFLDLKIIFGIYDVNSYVEEDVFKNFDVYQKNGEKQFYVFYKNGFVCGESRVGHFKEVKKAVSKKYSFVRNIKESVSMDSYGHTTKFHIEEFENKKTKVFLEKSKNDVLGEPDDLMGIEYSIIYISRKSYNDIRSEIKKIIEKYNRKFKQEDEKMKQEDLKEVQ